MGSQFYCQFTIPLATYDFSPLCLGIRNADGPMGWTIRLKSTFSKNLEITRQDLSGTFAINVNVSYIECNQVCKKRHWMGFMVYDEPSVLVPIPKKDNSYIGKFKGTVGIQLIPTPIFPSQMTQNVKQPPRLSDDFLCLLNNPDLFADATLKCGSKEIVVHKAVLSARSPVFAAMFKSQMQEGIGSSVKIVDIQPNVLQAMLRYVYSGKTDKVTNGTAGDLLFVAEKYQFQELKRFCIDKLISGITVNNVLRILVLGELHDEDLKTHAKEFVCKCGIFAKLEKKEEWKLLQAERPRLAMELLTYVVEQLCS